MAPHGDHPRVKLRISLIAVMKLKNDVRELAEI